MISVTEDKTSPEQILESFQIISSKDFVTAGELSAAQIPQDLVDFLTATLPKVDNAYDYKKFMSDKFNV